MNSKKINYILIIIWIFIVILGVLHHEVWRDEAKVWYLVQQLDFVSLINAAANDGHPFLWYLILYPFAKMNFPSYTMQIISCLFVFASVCIFLLKFNLNILNKILFVFSAGMLYFLPVIARNYALIPLFLFLTVLIYPERDKRPYLYTTLLILISQTHATMWGVAFIMWILFFYETLKNNMKNKFNQKLIKLFPIILFILYLVVMIFIFSKNSQQAQNAFIPIKSSLLSDIKYIVWYNILQIEPIIKQTYLISLIFLLIAVLKSDKKIFFILFCSELFIFFVLFHIWFGGVPYQKFFLVTLVFVFCILLLKSISKVNKIILEITLFIFLLLTNYIFNPFEIIKNDFKFKFSNTAEICQIIKDAKIKDNEYLVINPKNLDLFTFTFFDLRPKDVIYIDNEEYLKNTDYYNKLIYTKIAENPNYKYIIINDCFQNFINTTNYKSVLKINQNEKSIITGFSSLEYYNLFKIREL